MAGIAWKACSAIPRAPAAIVMDLTLPVHEYPRSGGISVTGGFVYRGRRYPELQGMYIYGDYGSGRIWGIRRTGNGWENRELLRTPSSISAFGEDAAGELYLADHGPARYT